MFPFLLQTSFFFPDQVIDFNHFRKETLRNLTKAIMPGAYSTICQRNFLNHPHCWCNRKKINVKLRSKTLQTSLLLKDSRMHPAVRHCWCWEMFVHVQQPFEFLLKQQLFVAFYSSHCVDALHTETELSSQRTRSICGFSFTEFKSFSYPSLSLVINQCPRVFHNIDQTHKSIKLIWTAMQELAAYTL